MFRSFFRMQPGSKKYFTQWIHDIWRNKFLFCAVMAGIVTLFPVLYIPVLNTVVFKHRGISWVSRSTNPTLHFIANKHPGMGRRFRRRGSLLRRLRGVQTCKACVLQKAGGEGWSYQGRRLGGSHVCAISLHGLVGQRDREEGEDEGHMISLPHY